MTAWWARWRRPSWWGSALVFVMLLLVAEYFWHQAETDTVSSDLLPALPQSLATDAVQTAASLQAFTSYDQPAEVITAAETVNRDTMSAEQQAQQQGLLRKLYIDDKVYQLSAILRHQQLVAVLSVSSADVENSQHLALKQGDTLAQYQIVALTERRLTLRQGERELWLELFIPSDTTSGDQA